MTTAKWAMLVYGLVMVAMGLDGYLRAGSPESLYGGGGMGAVVLIAFALALNMKSPRLGYILATLVALGGLGMFVPKLLKGEADAYPGGVIVLLSVFLIVVLVSGHFAAKKSSHSTS